MNEHSHTLANRLEQGDVKSICTKIYRSANMASVISSDSNILRYFFPFYNGSIPTNLNFILLR